jgi:thioesterase domain-containing protein
LKPTQTSAIVDILTPIWQRVLRTKAVGIADNFFDLGGDSVLAVALFNEIAVACGRELPPVMIYHAPTIAALGAVLEEQSTPRVPPVVQLKPGINEQPIFMAHGLGGSAMDFYQVVKYIETPRAIYGLQAKGIDGTEEPLDSIEEMARDWLEAVRQLQSHGPYLLVGFSLGGLVVLEMAQQLVADGERIGLLALLDSYPHISKLARGQRVRLIIRKTWRRMARRLGWLGVKAPFETIVDAPTTAAMQRSRASAYRALGKYKPRFYPGKINFVRAAIATDFPADAAAVWSPLAREIEVEAVPGDHLAIMTTNFKDLATKLSGYAREVEHAPGRL